MIRTLETVAVTLRPAADPMQIRRTAGDGLVPFKGKLRQKPVCAPVDELDREFASEAIWSPVRPEQCRC